MTRAVSLKILVVCAISIALASTPESSFAQRGGGGFHGSGGGFHGGGFHGSGFGGGSGFHGGGFGGGGFHGNGFHNGFGSGFGGFRNGGFNGFNGGIGGFHHGFGGGFGFPGWWGWGGWGWGWGLDIGFGWPYWGWGYPYYYDYGPYAYGYPYYPYDPYYYPNYRNYPRDRRDDYRNAPDNRTPENREPDYRHDNSKPSDQIAPAKPSNSPVPGDSRGQNYVTRNYGPTTGVSGTRPAPRTGAYNFQLASSTQRVPFGPRPLRPEVQNAIRLLRAMPPQARQQRLNSGRYASFSPAERELLTTATPSPQLN